MLLVCRHGLFVVAIEVPYEGFADYDTVERDSPGWSGGTRSAQCATFPRNDRMRPSLSVCRRFNGVSDSVRKPGTATRGWKANPCVGSVCIRSIPQTRFEELIVYKRIRHKD